MANLCPNPTMCMITKALSSESIAGVNPYLIERTMRSALAAKDEFRLPHDVQENKRVDLNSEEGKRSRTPVHL